MRRDGQRYQYKIQTQYSCRAARPDEMRTDNFCIFIYGHLPPFPPSQRQNNWQYLFRLTLEKIDIQNMYTFLHAKAVGLPYT